MKTEESIQIIEEMIATARKDVGGDGYLYLSWGYLVLVSGIMHYLLLMITTFSMPWLPWPILMSLGGINQFIYIYRQEKNRKRSVSAVERMLGYLWGAVFICLILVLGMVGYKEFIVEQNSQLAYVLVLVLYGIGTFVSGGVLQFKPLIFGGIASWVIALVAYQVSFDLQLLLLSLAIVVSYILPGHLLIAKQRQPHV
ncbi:MAG: hypothetical protein ACFB10_17530 [Salibacteraceae bacterium]